MAEEPEENLITIFKQITEELKKTRESIENLVMKVDVTTDNLTTIVTYTLYDYYVELQELKKLFQWYAEKQTGRKYTKET